ncbi:alpha/beta fold hydrolase [Candidatus Hodarchaeum mangrovi]
MAFETLELNDNERSRLPGSFIEISEGYVHYELTGSENGDLVVLIHGFSSPYLVWDYIFEELGQSEFQVLRYDLFGRGFSDRPIANYNFAFFVQQLHELLQKLNLSNKKFNLVGLSMGGGITMTFADQYPDLIKKITLFDPIGFSSGINIQYLALKIPFLNRLFLKFLINHQMLINSQKPDFYMYKEVDQYLEQFKAQLKYKGYLKAIHSTILNSPFNSLKNVYQRVGKLNIPIQLFWGEKDKTIPFKTNEKVRAAIPHIIFHPIPNCGHMPQYTHPQAVIPLLLEFLRSNL